MTSACSRRDLRLPAVGHENRAGMLPTESEPERFSPAVHQSGGLNGFAVRAELGDAPRSRESSYSLRLFAHSTGYGENMSDWITMRRFHESKGVEDWRVVGEGACAYFRTASFAAGTRLVNAINELAGLEDHYPDVDLRHEGVIVRLMTVAADYYGLSERDLELARKISAIAGKLGVPAEPAMVQTVLITIDAFDIPKVKPFWRAVLGYQDREDSPEDLVDPRGRGPSIWFQKIDTPDPQVTRIHLDIWVPPDQAKARIAAAIAAGGHLVTDRYAPAWWTLADAEGNLTDVATTMSRD